MTTCTGPTPEPDVCRSRNAGPRLSPWIILAAGACVLPFAGGLHAIGVAAWIAPILLLCFLRNRGALPGLAILFVVFLGALAIQWRGAPPVRGWVLIPCLALAAGSALLPYATHRLLAPRLRGLAAALVFPSAWVLTEYLLSRGPMGSWGSAAYTQHGNLALCQVVSVTGLGGITFLIGWFAASVERIWEEGGSSCRARKGLALCAGILALVWILGEARLALRPPTSPKVRVASLSRTFPDPHFGRIAKRNPSPAALAIFRRQCATLDADLLVRSAQAAQAGARIVFWAETNGQILKVDEAGLIAQGQNVARSQRIYLGMALGVWNPGQMRPLENKFVLLAPDGAVAWEYRKTRPVPGGEAALCVPGEGPLPSLDTPFGRLSAMICFDADFPRVAAQAGRGKTGLMLLPANDWRAIDPLHTQMARFRALEQGFNLVRQASLGLSAAYDYQGRRLAVMDHFQTRDFTMVSDVPTEGVRTLYSILGDWFVWACGGALLALAWGARRFQEAEPHCPAPQVGMPL